MIANLNSFSGFHFFIGAFCCTLLFAPVLAADSSPEKVFFERAYQIESYSPKEAAELYKSAIREGSDPKLRRAALWRLFYLYKKEKDFGNAAETLEKLGNPSAIYSSLVETMKSEWGVDGQALDDYLKAMRTVAVKGKGNFSSVKDEVMSYMKSAYRISSGNQNFKKEIMRFLKEHDAGEEMLSFQSELSSISVDEKISYADLLYSFKKYGLAQNELETLALTSNDLSRQDKFRILYLLGRIYRDKDELGNAVAMFRYASFYADSSLASRQVALAAFSLYKSDYHFAAYSLMNRIPSESLDEESNLFKNILRAEIDNDSGAILYLKKRKREFIERKRTKEASYFTKRALEILDEKGE